MIIVIFVRQTWPQKTHYSGTKKKWIVNHIIDKKTKQTRIVCDLKISTTGLSICLVSICLGVK